MKRHRISLRQALRALLCSVMFVMVSVFVLWELCAERKTFDEWWVQRVTTSGFPEHGANRAQAVAWAKFVFDGDHKGDAFLRKDSLYHLDAYWESDEEEVLRKELQNVIDEMHYNAKNGRLIDFLGQWWAFRIDEESTMTRDTFERILNNEFESPAMVFESRIKIIREHKRREWIKRGGIDYWNR